MKALRLQAEQKEKSTAPQTRSANASKAWKNPRVEQVNAPIPAITNKEVLLKIAYCGVCGSDFHLAMNSETGTLFYPGLLSLPVTIGHEFSAVIHSHGEKLSEKEKNNFPIGMPVTAEEMLWCGECNACKAGHVNHCENLEEIGFTVDGAHAEFLKIGLKYCWSLKNLENKFGLDRALQMGALVEPYSVSYRALFQGAHISNWMPGNSILIIGAGPIGLAAIDLARASGATKIGVIEVDQGRRELAKKMGATDVSAPINAEKAKLWIESWNNKQALDWILDAAGATQFVTELSQSSLAVGGSLCLLARTDEAGHLNSEALITKNTRIFGSQGHSGQSAFPRVIALMEAERIHPLSMIDHIASMQEAQERLQTQKKCSGKILMNPSL